MTKGIDRNMYVVRMREPSGKEFSRAQFISDTGSNASNDEFIVNNLKDEFKTFKIIRIEKVERGTFLDIQKEILTRNIWKAIKDTNKIAIPGFAAKLPAKMRSELGVNDLEKLDDPAFHKYFIFNYVTKGYCFSLRLLEEKMLGVKSGYRFGGHVADYILGGYYNLYEEHKACLPGNDVRDFLKTMNKMNIEISKSLRDLLLMDVDNKSNKKKNNIDGWI